MNMKNYEIFLDFIMPVIDRKFENQKEYLACKKGCALCCKTVSMPFSKLEFEYLIVGLSTLDNKTQKKVKENIKNLINNSIEPVCPFLISETCTIYKYRGLICRMFGLLLISDDEEYTVPFCVHNGLNYANVFDEETQKLSLEKIKNNGFKNDPIFHNLSREKMFNLQIFKDLELEQGETKPLIEWLKDYYKQKSA